VAAETTYFVAVYDNEASGPFVAQSTTLVTWPGGTGFIVTLIDDGTIGKLAIALVSGDIPTNNETLTQGATTADTNGPAANGDSENMLYPAFFREDTSLAATGAMAWTGPALGATHSFLFDGQTANVVVGEILTFSPGGQQCEVVTIVSDAGAAGELDVRWISFLDTLEFPDDNDTFTGDIIGDGTLNMVVHPRCYGPLNLHRLLGDLGDDSTHAGNDVRSVYNATASARDTDQIVRLLDVTITDTIVQHMTGGSVEQSAGAVLYSGLDVQVTDSDGGTQPVVIQDDAIVTAYWENAYMPDSVSGKVRIMLKTRNDDVTIDGGRVKGKLLRYGDTYFEGSTTLGDGAVGLALFSSADGNNTTAVGTVAGAPYNTITQTEGYQLIDYNNGNGAQPFAYEMGFGTATSAQAFERTKYIQRRGTAETLFGRNAQLFTGVNIDYAYDAESGAFSEDEELAWGTEMPYTGETGGPFTVGNVLVGATSGARGRIIYLDDQGLTGTMILAQDAGAIAFNNTETIDEFADGVATGAAAVSGTVVTNSASGVMILMALDDNGADGFFYGQQTRGVAPADNQTVYGATSLQTADADVATSLNLRTVNTQYIGSYTGSAYNPANFGMAIDPADAIASDLFTDLLGATQQPPNNQTGTVTDGLAGDYVTAYPWDGAATDVNGNPLPTFAEATLTTALIAATSTTAIVSAIPINTPAAGWLRIERDSDNELDLVEYASWTGLTYTLVGTAPSAAAIGNNVMRAFIDRVWATTGVPETYQAVQSGSNQVAVSLLRGGLTPIKPFKGSATFGATGFTAAAQRIADA
jgi:hypothetical protein